MVALQPTADALQVDDGDSVGARGVDAEARLAGAVLFAAE